MIVIHLRFKFKSHCRGGTEREGWERHLSFHQKVKYFYFIQKRITATWFETKAKENTEVF